ncbi:MAG: cobalt-precorrin-6A reductase [Alphaproteobacteria bacterium]
MLRVLILGGTGDARELGRLVAEHLRLRGSISLAGRTAQPAPQPLPVHQGGFGGAEGLEAFLRVEKIDALIDATHPFAQQISANAVGAAAKAGVPRLCLARAPWLAGPGDNWRTVAGEPQAATALPDGSRAFLALGAGRLDAFADLNEVWCLVRVVDAPLTPLLRGPHQHIVGRGPFSPAHEAALLAEHRISHIVCRNSGTSGAWAKLEAARAAQIPVIMITAPPPPPGPMVDNPQCAMDWLVTAIC